MKKSHSIQINLRETETVKIAQLYSFLILNLSLEKHMIR